MLWVRLTRIGCSLALLNVLGTLQIWRSGVYERDQLLAQTALIWVVPGFVIVVVFVLKTGRTGRAPDSTSTNPDTPNLNAVVGAGGVGAP